MSPLEQKDRRLRGGKRISKKKVSTRTMIKKAVRGGKIDFHFRGKKKTFIDLPTIQPRGPFLERPGNFSGPKSNIQIEIKRIGARILARKLLHFVSLTDSFIMLDAKLLKPRSLM